jgi:MFS family permease
MQRIAMAWLVYRLTDSEILLGVVGFATQIPNLIIAPFVGVLADRYNRHRIIIVTQSLAMIQALILAWLVLTNQIEVWHIIALSIFQGTIFAFDMPTRQAFLPDIVEKKEDLSNAIALNSILFNSARLIGPTLAGIVIATVGEGICFLINGFSYLTVIIALALMKLKPRLMELRGHNLKEEFVEGARYSFGFAPIRAILQLLAIVSLSALSYMILMPVFAREVLGGDAKTLGYLMAAIGVGAIIGGLVFAMRKSVKGIGKNIVLSTAIFSTGVILFSLSNNLHLSMLFLAIVGFGQLSMFSSCNTTLQNIVDDNKRGRVMAFYTASILGFLPFGSIIAGSMAEFIGAPVTLIIGGIICLVAAFDFYRKLPALRKVIRPIFVELGVKY